MKYILTFVLLFCSSSALARQVTVTATGPSAQNSPGEFSLEEGRVEISGSTLTITDSDTSVQINGVQAAVISPEAKLLGILRGDGDGELQMQVYDSNGREIRNRMLDYFNPNDQSLEIIQFDNGRSIVRDNIANFTFFETDGSQAYNISNSTQSEAGETISEIKSDDFGPTVVLYNPQINFGNEIGSRARIVHGPEDVITISESRVRNISFVSVSNTGKFITLISKRAESDDEVTVFDRFGNGLGVLTSEEDLTGAVLSGDGEFLTIFSQFRVQVYRVENGERIGSSSLQAEVVTAAYQPAENQIVVLTGDSDTEGRVTGARIYAIDISARSLGSDDISGVLTYLDADDIRIGRIDPNRFQITGFNRLLEVQTSF